MSEVTGEAVAPHASPADPTAPAPGRRALSRRYEILDPPSDGAFDRIAGMAAQICGTPVSTVSIVDEDRVWLAAGALSGQTRPQWCQLGGTRQCQQSAELKVADSWGDSAWGCWEHAEDALRQVPSVYLATETPHRLMPCRLRTSPPILVRSHDPGLPSSR